jgi:hypothetical protein
MLAWITAERQQILHGLIHIDPILPHRLILTRCWRGKGENTVLWGQAMLILVKHSTSVLALINTSLGKDIKFENVDVTVVLYHAQQCKLAPYPTAMQILARRLQDQDAADNAAEGDRQRRKEDEGQVTHHASMNIALYEMMGRWVCDPHPMPSMGTVDYKIPLITLSSRRLMSFLPS